jgi:D-glycero-alpha-D-manno-heptose 1-phosphate guanylyltransferase
MEAIVLAGGFGTRLRQVVPDLPKPMAPIAGRPFLEILLASLAKKGFKRIVLSLGFMADKIIGHFGNQYLGMELVYEVESQPLGTGGAVRAALSRCVADHSFVFNGDTYLDLEVAGLEALWQSTRCPAIVVREVPDTARFGRVVLTEGRVTSFLEKGLTGPGMINAGCYVLPKNLLDDFPPGQNFSLETDFFYDAIQRMKFSGFVTEGLFIDIGVPDDYELAQTLLASI